MNKGELIEEVAKRAGLPRSKVGPIVEAVFEVIVFGAEQQQKVAISGFGTFRKKYRKARTGINPATKEPIQIQACTTIGFTPSAALKNGVEEPQVADPVSTIPHL